MPAPLLVVLTGPSGAGKDSVLDELRKLSDRPYAFITTVTTRPPRPTERDGVDYHFVSKNKFKRMVDNGEMLEHAIVYGQEKGVPKDAVRQELATGHDVLMRTDVQGARYIKSIAPGTVTIFIAPPSDAELEKRMRSRGGDTEEQIDIRLQTAREEIAEAPEFDHMVLNDDLRRAVANVEQIIAKERARKGREPVVIG
ncbi:MAG: guanylate kinase [Chloroflexota bacterium]